VCARGVAAAGAGGGGGGLRISYFLLSFYLKCVIFTRLRKHHTDIWFLY